MERNLSPTIRRLISERKLLRAQLGGDAIVKEIKAAEYDLERGEQSFKDEDFKWATIKAYYSMFHAARSLLYHAGLRERSHAALITSLRELYVTRGELPKDALNNIENALSLRESADYGHSFSKAGAERVLKDAEKFLRTAKETLKAKRRSQTIL